MNIKTFFCFLSLFMVSCSVLDTNTQVSYNNPLLWQKANLTWGVDYTGIQLSPESVNEEIKECFNSWAMAGVFTFTQTTYAQADIKISFTELTTVGHASFPWQSEKGIIRLNSVDTWGAGLCLFSCSIKDWLPHEIGHALGLKHTLNESSVMREHGPYGLPTIRDLQTLRNIYSPNFKVLTWKHYDL